MATAVLLVSGAPFAFAMPNPTDMTTSELTTEHCPNLEQEFSSLKFPSELRQAGGGAESRVGVPAGQAQEQRPGVGQQGQADEPHPHARLRKRRSPTPRSGVRHDPLQIFRDLTRQRYRRFRYLQCRRAWTSTPTLAARRQIQSSDV